MWFTKVTESIYVVDYRTFIESQPCRYRQVSDVIEAIQEPVDVFIDVSLLDMTEVNLPALVVLVWELHEKTKEKQLLKNIFLDGVSPWVMEVWTIVEKLFPRFVSELMHMRF
jgi:hypothetical protein